MHLVSEVYFINFLDRHHRKSDNTIMIGQFLRSHRISVFKCMIKVTKYDFLCFNIEFLMSSQIWNSKLIAKHVRFWSNMHVIIDCYSHVYIFTDGSMERKRFPNCWPSMRENSFLTNGIPSLWVSYADVVNGFFIVSLNKLLDKPLYGLWNETP